MTERLQQPRGSGPDTAGRRSRRSRGRIWGARTIPVATARELAAESEPTLLGFPAEYAEDDDSDPAAGAAIRETPRSGLGLVVLRRPDPVGAGALVLAGVAANVSLSLSWTRGAGPGGLTLVRRGVEGFGFGEGGWVLTDEWEPLVVVLGGGLLVVFGLLLLVPARAHRLVGVLALLVTVVAGAAVVALVVDTGWGADAFGPGLWCASAVPVLGALGSLKAMLTAPKVTLGLR